MSNATDEVSIRSKVEQYVTAHNNGDAKAAASVYTADGSHTYAVGFTDRGRDAIEQRLAEMFSGPWKGLQLTLAVNTIRFLGPDVAVEDETFEVTGLRGLDGTEMPAVRGVTLIVWVRQRGDWLVAAGQGMIPFTPAPVAQEKK